MATELSTLQIFHDVYEVERQVRDLPADERRRVRQEVTLPKLNAFHTWMSDEYRAVTPKSPIGKALEYSLKRWKELDKTVNEIEDMLPQKSL